MLRFKQLSWFRQRWLTWRGFLGGSIEKVLISRLIIGKRGRKSNLRSASLEP